MGGNKKIYSKLNPERDILPKRDKVIASDDIYQHSFLDNVSISYQKPSKELLAKAFFIIISGGEVREKKYFKIISNQDKFKRIKIDFIADPKKLSPKGMLEIAQFKKVHYMSSQMEGTEIPDKIFLVTDVDEFMPQILEIYPKCAKDQLYLIVNNSCFEVWLYYAYHSAIPNFPITDRIETISWKFKEWLPTVIIGGINPIKAVFNIHQNIKNAKLNYKEDLNGIPLLFSSNMFVLAEELLPLIDEELNKQIEENKKREIEYQKRKNQ